MNINKETLHKIAHLARLNFEGHSEEEMITSMNDMIHWVEQLKEVDTDGVEPLTHMSEEINVLRDDIVKPHLSHERGLKNAPQKDSDYFRVPKVME